MHADRAEWHFLTGSGGAAEKLSAALYLTKSGAAASDHTDRLVLVDAQGAVRGYYSAFDPDAMEKLPGDIKELLGE
jgi:hypothetical protein